MRARLLLALLLAATALCLADGQKIRRRHRRLRTTTEPPAPPAPVVPVAPPIPVDADHVLRGIAERLDEQRYQDAMRARLNDVQEEGESPDNDVTIEDPCLKVHCSAGRICEIDEHGEAVCNCIKDCPYETDSRRKVCTNHNETWPSDCEVYRQRCLCLDGSDLCRGPQYHHVQIEYYGSCREMPECVESEMSDFPRRMRDWLFNIMRDLAERRELTPHYLKMEREAESNLTRRWTNAAIWKWCDLDAHTTRARHDDRHGAGASSRPPRHGTTRQCLQRVRARGPLRPVHRRVRLMRLHV
ncbi:SPARC [Eumeta japonica]|uniref:SPARC n=1 Tax=Eumeta variegata TaxID=151549 RepID=A0A4C1W966_EUMVA|nr:SPARC [Eumeta japonica]